MNVFSVGFAFALSLGILGGFYGVGLGTLFMMVAQGYIVKALTPAFKRVRRNGHLDRWMMNTMRRGMESREGIEPPSADLQSAP